MQVDLEITHSDLYQDTITITGKLTPRVTSNYTITNEKLFIKIGDELYEGIIKANDNEVLGYVTWTIANATKTIQALAANTYTITGNFTGDDYHFGVVNYTQFLVQLRETWIKIAIQNYTYGHYGLANITTNGNGTIMLSMNGRTERYSIENGTLLVPFDTLYDPGIYYMSVIYVQDEYYNYATNETSFEVYWLNTTVNATPINITYGENEIINVTVNKTATGYIVVNIKGSMYLLPLENGTVEFNISGLAVGKYENATVLYSGDTHFRSNSTNITFTVSRATDYVMDVKVDNITYGQDATIRVKVPTDAKGNVTIYVDGVDKGTVNVTDGSAELKVSGLAGGEHVVNVTYNGDSSYAPKDKNNTKLKVNPNTTWDFTITGDYQPYGEYSTITLRNLPQDLGENITIKIDDVSYVVQINNVAHTATLKLNNISAGQHSGVVIYAGSLNYEHKEKKFFPTIPQATPTVTLTRNGNDVIATVSGNVTGNVTFRLNGNNYTVNLTGNTSTLVGKLQIGNNTVVATYNGDKNYTKAVAVADYIVDKWVSKVNVTVENTTYGIPVEITVKVGEGQTGFVKILVNGITDVAEIDHGQAIFYVNGLNVNNYTVNVTFYENDVFYSSENSTNFSVTKAEISAVVNATNATVEQNVTFGIFDLTP
jgi:hypothetical protein